MPNHRRPNTTGRFTVQFDTDNEAFVDDAGAEIERILTVIGKRVNENLEAEGNVFDLNGNAVGTWRWDV